jgi:Ca2+-binding RTX toxin-like protein
VKRLVAYGVAVAALLGAPPHALAQAESAPSVVAIFPPMRGPSTLIIHGSTSDNSVVLRFDVATSEYVVSDEAGVEAATGCRAITAMSAQCVTYGEGSFRDRFSARLSGGDDTFTMAMPDRGGKIEGGEGDDVLKSAEHRNVLLGGPGGDLLRGAAGNDALFADRGHDFLRGGQGNDLIDAQDGDRDTAIDCGPGDDVVRIDVRLDPRTRGCETTVANVDD